MGKPPGTLSPQRNAGRGCRWAGKGLPEALLQIRSPKAKPPPPRLLPHRRKTGQEVATVLLEDDFFSHFLNTYFCLACPWICKHTGSYSRRAF